MNKARARLKITGRVQGVGFRFFVHSVASGLRLKGYVRNSPDGSVEAVFEGDRAAIESALASCKTGPPGAIVSGADTAWEDFKGDLDGFRITRALPKNSPPGRR